MVIIAHRGNLKGANLTGENSPVQIEAALKAGFDAECDVWYKNGRFYLGHDAPVHPVNPEFLLNPRMWCHAKNRAALEQLLKAGAHVFWHERDQYTLTSRGYIWAYPGAKAGDRAVAVLHPGENPPEGVWGVCTDDAERVAMGEMRNEE